jgi:dTDP-4-dehydrorhamnose 3,5-epimerase
VFRSDWFVDNLGVDQVFQNSLQPGAVSGWHAHRITTDRIFVNRGTLRIALYDARGASETHGMTNQFNLGEHRPTLVVVPPGVWHAVANPGHEVGALLNVVDRAYTYDDPDHWRLPIDTPLIPLRFP